MDTPAILFVCMGNICRSPCAEAILRHKAELRHIDLEIDSAGTDDYHQGEAPDPRAQYAAARRGYSLSQLRARSVTPEDFAAFDLILTADHSNLQQLQLICPPKHQHKLALFLKYVALPAQEIPDPYYGATKGFDSMIDLIEIACDRLFVTLGYND